MPVYDWTWKWDTERECFLVGKDQNNGCGIFPEAYIEQVDGPQLFIKPVLKWYGNACYKGEVVMCDPYNLFVQAETGVKTEYWKLVENTKENI